MPLSDIHVELQNRISLYITALQNEIEALRNYSSRNYSLSAGKFLGNSEAESLYEFKLDDEIRIIEDVPVEIEVEGEIAKGTVVSIEADRLVLLLQLHVGDTVDHAILRTAPFFLLEQLIERLEAFEEEDVKNVEALFDEDLDEDYGHDPIVDPGNLNESQINAALAVLKRNISFVWGPPGTGKTQTLAFAAANLVSLGEKTLILSNTNIAVDVALHKTLGYLKEDNQYFDGKLVRFGIPRLTELDEFPWSLPQYISKDKNPALYGTIDQIETDIRTIMTRMREPRSGRKTKSSRLSKLREELSGLRQEAYVKENKIVQHANLVACTAAKAAIASQVFARKFDAVLIDEASMLYVPYVIHAASLARRRVAIFGDFMQIPPITQSSTKVLDVLSRDIFRESKMHRHMARTHPRMSVLDTQYRMPVQVMDLVNEKIYAGRLKASPAIASAEPKEEPVLFYDTSGLHSISFREATSNSRINILSGIAALDLSVEALKHGAKSVGIITPYRAQMRFLRSVLNSMSLDSQIVSAATVHTFQGNERDVIVFDFVDDKPLPLGILLSTYQKEDEDDVSEGERLLNVAMTRAKKRLLFVGNFEYLSAKAGQDSLMSSVLEKLRLEKTVVRMQIENRMADNYAGANIQSFSVHHGNVDSVNRLLRDIQGSTEVLKLVQPVKAKLQFFKYVLKKEVESSKDFGSLDMSVVKEKLKSTNLITSDKADLFFWVIDGRILHAFDVLNRDGVYSLRISAPEVVKVFNYLLPRKSSRITSGGGGPVDPHCSVCGGKMELKEKNGMIVAQCADNKCITVPADGRIIEALLEEDGHSCPVDAGKLRVRKGRKGYFVGCANYPACNWTAELGEILK